VQTKGCKDGGKAWKIMNLYVKPEDGSFTYSKNERLRRKIRR
jgi:hypothetical protein